MEEIKLIDYPVFSGMESSELKKWLAEEEKRCSKMTEWEDVDDYVSDEEYETFGTEEEESQN